MFTRPSQKDAISCTALRTPKSVMCTVDIKNIYFIFWQFSSLHETIRKPSDFIKIFGKSSGLVMVSGRIKKH